MTRSSPAGLRLGSISRDFSFRNRNRARTRPRPRSPSSAKRRKTFISLYPRFTDWGVSPASNRGESRTTTTTTTRTIGGRAWVPPSLSKLESIPRHVGFRSSAIVRRHPCSRLDLSFRNRNRPRPRSPVPPRGPKTFISLYPRESSTTTTTTRTIKSRKTTCKTVVCVASVPHDLEAP
jgi:hypothetical protein